MNAPQFIPAGKLIYGHVDGVPVSMMIDDSSPVSCIRTTLIENSTAIRLSVVETQELPFQFRRYRLSLVPAASTPNNVDVVLGRDWYIGCIMAAQAGCSGHRQYIHRILQTPLNTSSIFTFGTAVEAEIRDHGIHIASDSSDEPFTVLMNHLLTGQCSVSGARACSEVALNSRSLLPQDIVDHIVSQIHDMKEGELPEYHLARICQSVGSDYDALSSCQGARGFLELYRKIFRYAHDSTLIAIEGKLESMSPQDVRCIAFAHGLEFWEPCVDRLKGILYSHVSAGGCMLPKLGCHQWRLSRGCDAAREKAELEMGQTEFDDYGQATAEAMVKARIYLLRRCEQTFNLREFRRLLPVLGLPVPPDEKLKLRICRRIVREHILTLRKAKNVAGVGGKRVRGGKHTPVNPAKPDMEQCFWPRTASKSLKAHIISMFQRATSRDMLREFTCAVCGGRNSAITAHAQVPLCDINPSLLQLNRQRLHDNDSSEIRWPHPDARKNFPGLEICPDGVDLGSKDNSEISLHVCRTCMFDLRSNKTPALALANGLALGAVPPELEDLTPIEEALIARCRAKGCIYQLKESESSAQSPSSQRALRGNMIVFPQRPETLSNLLPPPIEELEAMICVIFVGSSRPTEEWIRERAKPLLVRRDRVRRALFWLKKNNPLYSNVTISEPNLDRLPESSPLKTHVQYNQLSLSAKAATAGYTEGMNVPLGGSDNETVTEVEFDKVVVADVDTAASVHELRAAAIRHLRKLSKGFIEVPHQSSPVNDFFKPEMFPMTFPTLYPYGTGGFEDTSRARPVSLRRHVKHLLSLADGRFRQHTSFIFLVFNILQRREALLHTKLKTQKSTFESLAQELVSVSFEAIQAVTGRVSQGDSETAFNDDERRVLKLMKQVKLVTSHVPGSSAARTVMRNEIRALTMSKGLPSFFVTINPADVYNPLVKFLAGADIDIDRLLPEEVPKYRDQSILVARDPVVAAKFFNIYVKAFIKEVLGWGSDSADIDQMGGILGKVSAYYGCVEAQGRGTLHCHMLVWIKGALNPSEIRQKVMKSPQGDFVQSLIEMLEDTISNEIPELPPGLNPAQQVLVPSQSHMPCSVRGVDPSHPEYEYRRRIDLHYLAKACQVHKHGVTCYKYWKGPPEPRECRFDLDTSNERPITTVDPETGEVHLRCLNGLVNNFNETILEAIRCNMDIKFIGSGQSAKAIIHYVTDYITKTQLKAHVAYSALEMAIQKLGNLEMGEEDHVVRAKRMLQKCAFAMISRQELSGQQVASYLMDYEDHFTSDKYRGLWWTAFESAIEQLDSGLRLTGGMDVETDSDGRALEDPLSIEEEVTIYAADQKVLARSGQVADYLCRGPLLNHLSVWDFVSRVDKIKKSKRSIKRPKSCGQGVVSMDDVQDNGDDSDTDMNEECDENMPKAEHIISPLTKDHLEHRTHSLRLIPTFKARIPVPIGAGSLPRRDRPVVYERYCRLMLILFKPWKRPLELKPRGVSWVEAFERFKMDQCSERFLQIMENMQQLHECKDSRDDHFAQRHIRRPGGANIVRQEWTADVQPAEDDLLDTEVESDILKHLMDIDRSRSRHRAVLDETARRCVIAAEQVGLFDARTAQEFPLDVESESDAAAVEKIQSVDGPVLEDLWRAAYKERRGTARAARNLGGGDADAHGGVKVHFGPEADVRIRQLGVADQLDNSLRIRSSNAAMLLNPSEAELRAELIAKFTLNERQRRAFEVVARSVEGQLKKQLLLYIGGPGGTGKSRVIDTIGDYFKERGEISRIRMASYTGVAAKNISGTTLHSLLDLRGRGHNKKRAEEVISSWKQVDYLLVDEVSMIGCQSLLTIHEALVQAKCCDAPFGGVNLIFCGDFAQLPPIGDAKLTSRLDTRNVGQGGTVRGQSQILGKLLWLQFVDVVLLTEPMRQLGKSNTEFFSLLQRLRVGACTDADFELLNTRLAHKVISTSADISSWLSAITIVSGNATKDALNEKAAEAFAKSRGRRVHWYIAEDLHCGKPLTDPDLLEYLRTFHSGQTGQRLQRIPLVVGMPVVLYLNYDVENGAVNGTTGIVTGIRYVETTSGERIAKSCTIQCPDYTGDSMPRLEPTEIPVLQDRTKVTFTHPHSGKKVSFVRVQLPIAPAFAVTAHKSQGLTLNQAIVDLAACRGTEAPYVMLSRVRSLSDLIILREFPRDKISCRFSEHTRQEFLRLEVLDRETSDEHRHWLLTGQPGERSIRLSLSKEQASQTLDGFQKGLDTLAYKNLEKKRSREGEDEKANKTKRTRENKEDDRR